jgi:hypothetical protein
MLEGSFSYTRMEWGSEAPRMEGSTETILVYFPNAFVSLFLGGGGGLDIQVQQHRSTAANPSFYRYHIAASFI